MSKVGFDYLGSEVYHRHSMLLKAEQKDGPGHVCHLGGNAGGNALGLKQLHRHGHECFIFKLLASLMKRIWQGCRVVDDQSPVVKMG